VSLDKTKIDDAGAVGYAHARYAESLTEFGKLRQLPRCKGWLLERQIPDSDYRDAIGCYPMFSCQNWSQLHLDIAELDSGLVSLSLVPEVFGTFDENYLRKCFETVIPFKEHFVCDLHRPISDIVSRHHRRYAKKGLKNVRCERHPEPIEFLDDWVKLHESLVARHNIIGVRAYSRKSFALQLSTPGIEVLRATHNGITVGAQLWFVHEEVAYGHVLAFSELGYKLGAAYALYWFAIEYFADRVRYCDYAGVSGLSDDATSGLNWFKRGWSTEMRTAYFCGQILNRKKYDELVISRGLSANDFFPAYRTSF